ncbi:MAG: DUF4446 family protein [bacterium]
MELILSLGLLVAIGVIIFLYIKVQQIEKDFGLFFRSGDTPQSIMKVLNSYAEQEKSQNDRLKQLEVSHEKLEVIAEHAQTRIGFVRFNPFSDSGGDQSFCLATLDYKGNGWVVSSIHARTGSRVYAKQIILGHSSHNLSDEESTAVTKALKQNPYQHHHA